MPMQTQLIHYKSISDLITVLHIACAVNKAVEGTQEARLIQAARGKVQQRVTTRLVTLHKVKQ